MACHNFGGHAGGGHAVGDHNIGSHAVGGHNNGGHAVGGHKIGGHAVGGHAVGGHRVEPLVFICCFTTEYTNTDKNVADGTSVTRNWSSRITYAWLLYGWHNYISYYIGGMT